MINAIKGIIILLLMLLMSYPLLPFSSKAKRFSTFRALRYESPHNRLNFAFVILTVIEFVVVAFVFELLDGVVEIVTNLPLLDRIIAWVDSSLSSQFDFVSFAVKLVLVNLVVLYGFVFVKALLKKLIMDPIFGVNKKDENQDTEQSETEEPEHESDTDGASDTAADESAENDESDGKKKKKKRKGKKDDGEDAEAVKKTPEQILAEEEERRRARRRIPFFIHSDKDDEKGNDDGSNGKKDGGVTEDEGRPPREAQSPVLSGLHRAVLSLFFEGDEMQYARGWVVRVRTVMQYFIYLVEALYALFFLVVLVSVLFPLPEAIYFVLLKVLHVGDWYIYPFISVIFLQEVVNVFRTPMPDDEDEEDAKRAAEEEKDNKKREARLRALQSELKRRFDKEHALRYYPESIPEERPEYECTNRAYASAMAYIKKYMTETTGRTVQSYMECLDAIYNEDHVYFAASFYSELGEYLIAYSYIRLLAGSRVIFIVSDREECQSLKHYISDRLIQMTGSTPTCTWRVYTADERLDQADVLVACAEDFRSDNIVEQYPGFFEEVCNAIFIDADRTVALDSYLCLLMARRLQRATGDRIRFVFLSLDLLKGFAAASLPRFFNVDRILSFSSAKENEAVAYTLWNRESKKHRIYNRSGQHLTSLECIIADLACQHDVDGVRLMTSTPLAHAERKLLAMHGVEINKLYKTVADVNYMIYSDERCNLSAALYACTRFRGRKNSVVHILSKPYLLREYFMSRAASEDYINRSSFIQPRVTEHAERHKLLLLRIYCDATTENGISVAEFMRRMRTALATTYERGDIVSSAYCRTLLAEKHDALDALTLQDMASYLIAGLYDLPEVAPEDSIANHIKDYYLVIDPVRRNGYTLQREKYVVFRRVKEIFDRLFECNRRVELRLNDEVIGLLDTFPSRAHMEYIAGQSIIFNNSEYEIEHVARDGSAIFLRSENINFRNCLDTILLRRYRIGEREAIGGGGALHNTTSKLAEIRVTKCRVSFDAETYGFYSLMTDRQTLDFYRGVEGNPHVTDRNDRHYDDGRMLHVSLHARMECNDGMRLLLAAAFNEFIRTIFPRAYHCIAIVPVLAEPLPFDDENEPSEVNDRIRALYPYLRAPEGDLIETDANRMQFLFLNDCAEDIGALDWFYDRAARYMHEFLVNVYAYLHWLQLHPKKSHYIYFGGETLPECYDLEHLCELLSDLNLVLSDDGKHDYETAGEDEDPESTERCSFCHRTMESGRFSYFDKHRFICADCFDVVDTKAQIDDVYDEMCSYLKKTYPEVSIGAARADLDGPYELKEGQVLSEFYGKLDKATRTAYAERDLPLNNARVAVLRGLIELWQADNDLLISQAPAQLYYEELVYLRSIGEDESADWIYENLDPSIRIGVDEIKAYVDFEDVTPKSDKPTDDEPANDTADEPAEDDTSNDTADDAVAEDVETDDGEVAVDTPEPNAPDGGSETEDEATDDAPATEGEDKDTAPTPAGERRTSFTYLRIKAQELDREADPEPEDDDEEFSDALFDPNRIPRFWKRYLRGETADNGEDETESDEMSDATYDEDVEDGEGEEMGDDDVEVNARHSLEPNAAPPLGDEDDGTTDDGTTDEDGWGDDTTDDVADDTTDDGWGDDTSDEPVEDDPVDDGTTDDGWGDDPSDDPSDDTADEPSDGMTDKERKKAEKQRAKEEKKRLKEEEKRRKKEEKERRKLAKKNKGKATDDGETEDGETKPEKKRGLFGRRKKTEDETPDTEKVSKKSKKSDKDAKKDAKKAKKKGTKRVPYEDEEKSNALIRLYNDIVRAAFAYNEDWFSRVGVSDEDMYRVYTYVLCDYPELFWVKSYYYTPTTMRLDYRCKTPDGKLDVRQIKRKRKELHKAAKTFTQGITRKTNPYQAMLTIYRRLILTLDYDGVGLDAGVDKDIRKDDVLRSLHSALVEHKVVCAGYAVAMQYLLQSVGIVCGKVISEVDATNICHAFNVLKIGKYCYYLDATWGDHSDTKTGELNRDLVWYNYCCTPYDEFIRTSKGQEPMHIPNKELYPTLEQFRYTTHEYFRYHNAYLTRYDEREIVRIIAEAAQRYDEKEMGEFTIDFRCADTPLLMYVRHNLFETGALTRLLKQAHDQLAKSDKRAAKLLERQLRGGEFREDVSTARLYFVAPPKKKGKSDKKKK